MSRTPPSHVPAQRLRRAGWLGARVLVPVLLLSIPAATTLPAGVERVYGDDRIGTPVEVSRSYWDESDVALLATAEDFPDALSAGALAARLDAPLLLTEPDALPLRVGTELQRLRVSEVIVLGGPAAVSDEVLDAVGSLGMRVRRIAGADRYETAAATAVELGESDTVVVASGRDFPDALSTGNLSVQPGWPVLLVADDHVPAATAEAIERIRARLADVVGGAAAVPDGVVAELSELVEVRSVLAGPDRYATNAAVIEATLDSVGPGDRCLIVASGSDFPDALAAMALAARVDGVLLLANSDAPPFADVVRFAAARGLNGSIVVGGPSAVDERVVWVLDRTLRGARCPSA